MFWMYGGIKGWRMEKEEGKGRKRRKEGLTVA